jgi:energy-coupling factor transporter transmembrane protein EcfT
LKSRDYLIESIVPVALAMLIIPFGVLYEAEALFAFAGDVRYLIIYPLYVTVFLFCGMNARYETHRHWQHMHERRELDTLDSKWKFLLKLLLVIIIYPFAVPLSPVLLFVVYNFFSVLYALAGYLSIVGIAVTLVLIIFLIFLLPKLRVLGKRRRFIKKLRALSESAGYELDDLHIERSLRIGLAGSATFTLRDGNKIFSVRLLAIEKRRLPLYFTDDHNAHFLYKIGGKKHFISLARHFEYGVTGEGRRLLVISPEPKYVFVSSDGGQRRLFTGDKMWQYTVFEPDSFFGSMDRHCLGKNISTE